MKGQNQEIDITRNIGMIEGLKSELLTDMAKLYKNMINKMKDEMLEPVSQNLADIIFNSYIIGKRLGINYHTVEKKIHNKIRLGLIDNHEAEKNYGDLTGLSKHMAVSRNNNLSQDVWEK